MSERWLAGTDDTQNYRPIAVDSTPQLRRRRDRKHEAEKLPERAKASLRQWAIWLALANGKAAPRILGQPSALAAQIPGMIQYQHVATLRAHNKIVAASRLNAQEADKEIETLEQNIRQESIWVRENFAALSKIKAADRRSQAWLRCAQAALAAERFRISKERWPDSLDELVGTGYLESIPTDTYDYNPLRFRRTMDGLIIYSVGPDNTDNGGLIDRDRPLVPGTDLGFQLWDVTARRQPANPPVADAELKNEK